MIDPAVGALLAGAFALLFASASLHKLLDLRHFAEVFGAYEVLPPAFARLSPLVPLLELTVGAALLAGASRTGAAASGSALLVAYAAAIGINVARGRRDLSCGCGGPNDRAPVACWMVWRNLVLAALLGVTLLPWSSRPMGAADALTIGAGTAVTALLYISLDGLLGRLMPRTAAWRASPP
ncbi:MAG: methylamine utilization protein MauE [Gammaproteobacteria bacterium]|nr:methylamine utilization protein MauE [Gammaproteobacteria bacterium]